ncbi:MAG TPA: iron transporter [Chlorobaculum sp.]|jgi:ferrous iron transport protein A|uniref:Ferrous iron transport protein A n=1 Tax=Chlorobaculum tepidum (strain ATCC 49652 / DSM 12025 / NBRC 103806 / TLS) TaxID=194439 RepID=Q8KBP2_CHLTE|nr:ferrous iron transport protein A [Chlorobaculum tepidum]AAM72965.1 ferrous iron transport protein A [Chlorobaculum tepidum TLS]HBU24412.1 iron transporter [Chlorobaculum sp.]
MKLSELKKGQSARIVAMPSSGRLRKRLNEMGMLVGEIVRIEGVAPLGDPVEMTVRGYRLSLRRSDIENITVEEVR